MTDSAADGPAGQDVSDVPGRPVPLRTGNQPSAVTATIGPVPRVGGDTPFVGRIDALAQLANAVDRARDGEPSAWLVSGDAGVGKTRLLEELARRADGMGATVVVGRCVDLGSGGVPYLPFAEIVTRLTMRGELADAVAELPALDALSGGQVGPADDLGQRLPLFDAVRRLVRAAAAQFGVLVLILEDMHWADQSSRDLVTFLVARMRDEQLVVVGSYRRDDLHRRHPLRPVLSELLRLQQVSRIELEPFDRAELDAHLAALLGHPVSARVVDDVLSRSEGNAYFAEELAAHVGEGGLPAGLTDVLLLRLETLSPAAQRLARAASVAGDVVTDETLLAVTGTTAGDLDEALRDAVTHQVLVPASAAEAAPAYGFRHALLREAVYADLLPGERARLHGAYAAELQRSDPRPGAAATIAHHAMAAHDLPVALGMSLLAAQEASTRRAPADALGHLERAVTLWPVVAAEQRPAGTDIVGLELEAARAASEAGELGRAVSFADDARGQAETLGATPEVRAMCELRLAGHLWDVERETDSAAASARALAILADRPMSDVAVRAAAAQARAQAGIAHDTGDADDIERARDVAGRAAAAARELGLVDVETDVLITQSLIDLHVLDSTAKLTRALELARTGGHRIEEVRAAYYLASGPFYSGDIRLALARLPAAIAAADGHGLTWSPYALEARVLQVIAEYVTGDWDASVAASRLAGRRPPDVAAARLATAALYVHVARGDADVEYRIAELRDAWHQDGQIALIAGGLTADHLSWQGRHRDAIDAAQQVIPFLNEAWGEWYLGGIWLGALTLAAHADLAAAARLRGRDDEVGELERAGAQVIADVRGRVEHGRPRSGMLGAEGRAWLARAEAELARLEGGPGVELWEATVAAFDYGYPYETARSRWRLAAALVDAGRPDEAVGHVRAAHATAVQLGAAPLAAALVELVRRSRLKVDLGPGATTRAPVADLLTARERDVLALLAQGFTNGQIGRSLHISPKTASVHVSNLISKLDASGRTEVVALAYERGLLEAAGQGLALGGG